MKKITYKIITAILLLGINITYIHGQSISTESIDDFDINNANSSIKDLKGSIDNITKELFILDEKQKTEEGLFDQYKEMRNGIVEVIQSINITTEKVNKIIQQIALYKKEIIKANEEVKTSRSGSKNSKEQIKEFLNVIYKIDKKLYSNDGSKIDTIKLLINSDNIPRTLANDYAVQSMIIQLNNLIKNFDEEEQYQIENMQKFNNLKKQAQAKLKEYQTDLEKLQQQKSYLIQFLGLYKSDKDQRKYTIAQLFESTKSVYDKVEESLQDIKKEIYKGDFNMDKKLKELEDMDNNNSKYSIAWPLYPIYNIQSYFGDIDFQKEHGFPQQGIQIKAQQGTPVYAARDGIVYLVADNEEIGINRAMIIHTDGYVTVYEYLNRTTISIGDIVRRGQIIGYSGGEPGTRGAGFISKGPNLTFMVFKNGIAIDPFELLDASQVQDKSVLPEGYHIKYLRDKYARPIDVTNLKIMEGNTVDERAHNFLGLYGVGIYKYLQFREDAVKNTNIDRDVVICIAFAESTLGKYLSTANNIGNVGNDDSGNRVPMQSALGGARSIALTLNNQHLGHYHTINQLSRYGNSDGKIYASSPINWQTNVLKCLSQIKGFYIPEDYPFRTGTNPNLKEEHQKLVEVLKTQSFKR
ncbi:MAG: peptidoglycan DD-metalloendopeptidase family protein [Candidatus Absconditabacteria bacterium]|nr:peptidoglycan DD-metalloendopeptidase family protein [Candidatus Absconditabacteria bacterium]